MAAIGGQPAPKPGSLGGPVAAKNDQANVDQLMADYSPPQMSAPADSAPVDPQLMADYAPPTPEEIPVADVPTVMDEMPWERNARIGDTTQAAKEIVGDQIARFRASWAVTDDEKMGLLKKIYGPKGVRTVQDGDKTIFQIRRPGEKGFRDFDPEGSFSNLDIVGDVLDFSRDATEGAITIGERVLQARGGPKGAPGSPTKMPPNPGLKGLAGAADAVVSLNAGDLIAENLIGIERDPKRDRLKENAMAAGIGGGISTAFGLGASALARRRIARELKSVSLTSKDVLETAKSIEEAANNLADNGINLRQGKMVLTPGQVAGDLMPEGKLLDHELSTEQPVRDFFVEQGKLVLNGWEQLKQSVVNMTGKPPEELFTSVKSAAKATKELEGKTIGGFRDAALKATKGTARPMPKTAEALNPFLQTFGFDQVGGRLRAPTLDQLKSQFPDANEAVLGRVISLAKDLEQSVYKNGGNIPLKDVDRIYSGFRDTIDSFIDTQAGRGVARKLIGMKNALRDDWAQHIGAELKESVPDALGAYEKSMEKYSNILGAQESLRRTLKNNELSAAALAKQIFSSGMGKEKVKQMKVLLESSGEGLWDDMVGHHLNRMQLDAIDPKTGRVVWGKIDKGIRELEKAEILGEMFAPEQQALMKNFLTVARKVDPKFNFKPGEKVDGKTVGMVRNMIILGAGQISNVAKVSAGQNIVNGVLSNLGKDKAVVKWLQGEGLELVMNGIPKKEQGKIRKWLIPALDAAVDTGLASVRRNEAVQYGLGGQQPMDAEPQ